MMQQPFVSIVIPTRNAAPTVRACLESMAAQDYPRDRTEVILVDGRSTDDTERIAKEFDAVFMSGSADGPTAARMEGLARARGEVIAFTDADCVADPSWLSRGVQHLRDGAADVVGGPLRTPAQNGIATAIEGWFEAASLLGLSQHRRVLTAPRNVDVLPTSNFLTNRSTLDAVGPVQWKGYGGDILLSKRMRSLGLRITQFPDVLMTHHKRTDPWSFAEEMFRWGSGRARSRNGAFRYDLAEALVLAGVAASIWLLARGAYAPLLAAACVAVAVLLAEAAWCGVHTQSWRGAVASPLVLVAGAAGWFAGYTKGLVAIASMPSSAS